MRLKIFRHWLALLLVSLYTVSAVMNKRFIEYDTKFSGDLPEEILQPSYLPRKGHLSQVVIVGLSVQQDARPSDYARLKKIAQMLAPLTPRGRRNSKFSLQDFPTVVEVDNQAAVGPVYRGPNKIIYETGDGEREVREVEEPGKSFQKLFAPSNYPLASTPKPRTHKKTTTTTTPAPPSDLFVTETQEIFNTINYNLTLAEGLKMGHVVEFNRSVLGPAKENGVYISSKRHGALNKLIVVNDNGLTCADICSQIKGERSGYGTIGLCTAKFCQCDFRSRKFSALDCPTDAVFDPILLACNSPRNVLLCDDGRFEEEVVPTTQKPPEYPPTGGSVGPVQNMASYPAKVELVSNGISQKLKHPPLGIMHVVRPAMRPQSGSLQLVQEPGLGGSRPNEEFSQVSNYELMGMQPPVPLSTQSSAIYQVPPVPPIKTSQEIIEMTPPPPPDSKTTYIITLVSPQAYSNLHSNPYQEILAHQQGNPVGALPPQSLQILAQKSPQVSAYQSPQVLSYQSPPVSAYQSPPVSAYQSPQVSAYQLLSPASSHQDLQLHQISPHQASYQRAAPQLSNLVVAQTTPPPALSQQVSNPPTSAATSHSPDLSSTTQETNTVDLQNEVIRSRPQHNLTYSPPPAPVYRPRGPTILQPVGSFQRPRVPTTSAILIQGPNSPFKTQISNLIDNAGLQEPLVLTGPIGRPSLQTQEVPQIQPQFNLQVQQQIAPQVQQQFAPQVQPQVIPQIQPQVIPEAQPIIVPQRFEVTSQQPSNQQILTTDQLKSIVGSIFQQTPVAVTNQIENYVLPSSTAPSEAVQTYDTLHGELMPPLPPAEILRVTRAPPHFPHGLPNGKARLINAGTEKSPIYAYVNMQTYFVLPSSATFLNNSTNV